MELDTDKIDQAVLALLSLGRHDGYRVWKGFDWAVMNRLHEQGYITDPVSKAHSVLLTEEGARESERLRDGNCPVLRTAPCMKYGYARVSTDGKNRDLQLAALKRQSAGPCSRTRGSPRRPRSALRPSSD